jgi:hypothetical protein
MVVARTENGRNISMKKLPRGNVFFQSLLLASLAFFVKASLGRKNVCKSLISISYINQD